MPTSVHKLPKNIPYFTSSLLLYYKAHFDAVNTNHEWIHGHELSTTILLFYVVHTHKSKH